MEINDGDIVIVNKGAVVKSYNPSKREYVLKKSQKVKVYYQYDIKREIVWVGTGHYWCWTDKSNIQRLDLKSPTPQ